MSTVLYTIGWKVEDQIADSDHRVVTFQLESKESKIQVVKRRNPDTFPLDIMQNNGIKSHCNSLSTAEDIKIIVTKMHENEMHLFFIYDETNTLTIHIIKITKLKFTKDFIQAEEFLLDAFW